jgi:nicotinamidase-related amidase
MRSEKIWDASEVALVIIDYQEEMFHKLTSSDPREIELNMKFLINISKSFNIPIVLSTVGVAMGVNHPTRKSLKDLLPDIQEIDRTSMDAWEDQTFKKAVEQTGKKKLIFCALYTEICLTYPALEVLSEGYEVMVLTDAVAGLTPLAHKTAMKRLIQAGAIPHTTLALVTELFRDWKAPLASVARPQINQYLSEYRALDLPHSVHVQNVNEKGEARVEH